MAREGGPSGLRREVALGLQHERKPQHAKECQREDGRGVVEAHQVDDQAKERGCECERQHHQRGRTQIARRRGRLDEVDLEQGLRDSHARHSVPCRLHAVDKAHDLALDLVNKVGLRTGSRLLIGF